MASIEFGSYHRGNSAKYHDCIDARVTCLVACETCSDACLDDKDIAMTRSCMRLDRDCADACAAAIRVMSRGGPLSAELCRLYAEAYRKCTEACRRIAA